MSWRRGKAYTQDLRDRVLAARGGGFGKWLSALASVRPTCRGCVRATSGCVRVAREGSTTMFLKEPLMAKVALTPEHTQVQLCQWVWVEHAIEVGATTMGKT